MSLPLLPPCAGCQPVSCPGCGAHPPTRRQFLNAAATALAGATLAPALALGQSSRDPVRQTPIRHSLRVRPVLTYELSKRREATSWRPWGGLHSIADVNQEKERIGRELDAMRHQADFPLELLPLEAVHTTEQAAALRAAPSDVILTYAAAGSVKIQEAVAAAARWNLMFVRHRSGPVYLWYEIAHPRFLRKTVDEYGQPGMDVHDVVVDRQEDLLWRLRALSGLKNALNKKIVAVGGPAGWGQGGRQAPAIAREQWKMDLIPVTYDELGQRIQRARQDSALVKRAHAAAARYLSDPRVKLQTNRAFVDNAFVLTEVFRDLLDAAGTDAITINQCMGTIMPISETTACLPLSILNDEGYMAFCESDFVVIPSGVLLHYLSGKPVFLNDPTYPHHDMVTLAHCTAPRRMDGNHDEPALLLTHFESDYGAAPKVEMRKSQAVTNLIPDFASKRWVGFTGEIMDNPFLDICRSQIDVTIEGSTRKLLEEMKGFHWMTGYGRYLDEAEYALRKLGVELVRVT